MQNDRSSLEGFCVVTSVDAPEFAFFDQHGNLIVDHALTQALATRLPRILSAFYEKPGHEDFILASVEENLGREMRHRDGRGQVVIFTDDAIASQYINGDIKYYLDIHKKYQIRTPYKAIETLLRINAYSKHKKFCPVLIPNQLMPRHFHLVNLFYRLPAHVRELKPFEYILLKLEKQCVHQNLRQDFNSLQLEPMENEQRLAGHL